MASLEKSDSKTVSESKGDRGKSSAPSVPAGNRLSAKVLAKLYSYLGDSDKKDAAVIISLGLVCKSFNEFFTSPKVWKAVDKRRGYHLLQNKTLNNIWDSQELNNWYIKLCGSKPTIPGELWCDRKLLTIVLQKLPHVVCAPSRENFLPYSNDPVLSHLLVRKMAAGSCFGYLSIDLRGDKELAMTAIKRFGSALMHCAENLLADREFVNGVIAIVPRSLKFLGPFREDIELVVLAAKKKEDLNLAIGKAKPVIDSVRWLYEKDMCPSSTSGYYRGERCPTCGLANYAIKQRTPNYIKLVT